MRNLKCRFKWNPIFALGILALLVALSYILLPDNIIEAQPDKVLQAPSAEHWLGTDSIGRDYFARLVMGTRVSFIVGLISSIVALVIGIGLGSWLGQSLKWNRFLFSRFVDVLQGLPSFMMVAILMQIVGSTSWLVLSVLMGLFHWPGIARLTQSQVFKTQSEPYIEAAKVLGAKPFHVLKSHVWPACYPIWAAWVCYNLPAEIMFESSLSFLGFGVQPPQVSLGLLIQEAWHYFGVRPFFLFAPSTIIFFMVFILYRSRKST